jgi:hypothetical protein
LRNFPDLMGKPCSRPVALPPITKVGEDGPDAMIRLQLYAINVQLNASNTHTHSSRTDTSHTHTHTHTYTHTHTHTQK